MDSPWALWDKCGRITQPRQLLPNTDLLWSYSSIIANFLIILTNFYVLLRK
jgi:hypothetical protein